MKKKTTLWSAVAVYYLIQLVAAPPIVHPSNIWDVPCSVVVAIIDALKAIVPSLITLFFFYGGGRYAYSRGDPGARKQALDIMIHAIIAAVLFSMLGAILLLFPNITSKLCPNIGIP